MEYTQVEFLQLIQQYNSTDRRIIKANLKHIMDIYNIKPADIAALAILHEMYMPGLTKARKIYRF